MRQAHLKEKVCYFCMCNAITETTQQSPSKECKISTYYWFSFFIQRTTITGSANTKKKQHEMSVRVNGIFKTVYGILKTNYFI